MIKPKPNAQTNAQVLDFMDFECLEGDTRFVPVLLAKLKADRAKYASDPKTHAKFTALIEKLGRQIYH